MLKGADEKTPQKYINWVNEIAYITIFQENTNLLTDKLHLVSFLSQQIAKMGCCGSCQVLFSLLGAGGEEPLK
jgi:hypothetical protein